jgi:DNA-binding response OmpR family regulator
MAVDHDPGSDPARGASKDRPATPTCHAGAIGFRLEHEAATRPRRRGRGVTAQPSTPEAAVPAPPPPDLEPGRALPVATELDVELDLVAHELRRRGMPVHLRPREFRLLSILAANPGRAFTRRQLLDLAWDPSHGIDTRTVDVHVHWLRSKIEAIPRRPVHLVTIRGYGYRLDPWAADTALTNR